MYVARGSSTSHLPLPVMRSGSYRQGQTEPLTALLCINNVLHSHLNFKTSNREENYFFRVKKRYLTFLYLTSKRKEALSASKGEKIPPAHSPTLLIFQVSTNNAGDLSPGFRKL